MTNEEILGVTVLNSWKLAINRLNKTLSELSDEQLRMATMCKMLTRATWCA